MPQKEGDNMPQVKKPTDLLMTKKRTDLLDLASALSVEERSKQFQRVQKWFDEHPEYQVGSQGPLMDHLENEEKQTAASTARGKRVTFAEQVEGEDEEKQKAASSAMDPDKLGPALKEEGGEEQKSDAEAAATIQRAFRGYVGRNRAKQEAAANESPAPVSEEAASAASTARGKRAGIGSFFKGIGSFFAKLGSGFIAMFSGFKKPSSGVDEEVSTSDEEHTETIDFHGAPSVNSKQLSGSIDEEGLVEVNLDGLEEVDPDAASFEEEERRDEEGDIIEEDPDAASFEEEERRDEEGDIIEEDPDEEHTITFK